MINLDALQKWHEWMWFYLFLMCACFFIPFSDYRAFEFNWWTFMQIGLHAKFETLFFYGQTQFNVITLLKLCVIFLAIFPFRPFAGFTIKVGLTAFLHVVPAI